MWALLDRLHDEGRLVDLERDLIDAVVLSGFLSALSADPAFLTIVRHGRFDGASIVRIEEVTAVRWSSTTIEAWAGLLLETPSSPEMAEAVDLAGWESAIASLAGSAPLPTFRRERGNESHVGIDASVRDGWLEARAVGPAGDVDGAFAFDLDRLTRLDFGGACERSLWRLAEGWARAARR